MRSCKKTKPKDMMISPFALHNDVEINFRANCFPVCRFFNFFLSGVHYGATRELKQTRPVDDSENVM